MTVRNKAEIIMHVYIYRNLNLKIIHNNAGLIRLRYGTKLMLINVYTIVSNKCVTLYNIHLNYGNYVITMRKIINYQKYK